MHGGFFLRFPLDLELGTSDVHFLATEFLIGGLRGFNYFKFLQSIFFRVRVVFGPVGKCSVGLSKGDLTNPGVFKFPFSCAGKWGVHQVGGRLFSGVGWRGLLNVLEDHQYRCRVRVRVGLG